MLWALKPISHGLRAEAEGRGKRRRRLYKDDRQGRDLRHERD